MEQMFPSGQVNHRYMQPQTVYLSSAYLAPVSYYAKLHLYNKVYIERFDHYQKQTYRNRCHIAGPNGVLPLSIPIVKPDTPKAFTKDIRISEHGHWRHTHWNAIESAYNHTPFFDYYKDDFRPFYEKHYEFLFDFNEELRRLVCNLIDISPNIHYTSEIYKTDFAEDEIDLRESIHPKKDYTQYDTTFTARPYYQVFEAAHGFLPNLSIIDLLFNMGPEGVCYL
jgi:hypothetical protein